MRNLSIILFVLACGGTVDGFGTPADEVEPDAAVEPATTARTKFETEVLPLITTTCSGCHAGSDPAVEWMKLAPDEYTAVLAWPLSRAGVVTGWDPTTGGNSTLTSAQLAMPASAAIAYAVAKGDMRRVSDFYRGVAIDGVVRPVTM